MSSFLPSLSLLLILFLASLLAPAAARFPAHSSGAPLCTPAEARRFGDAFEKSKWAHGHTGTSCPSWFWLDLYDKLYPPKDDGGVFVDVGCNVGYSSARLFASYRPELEFTPEKVYSFGTQLAAFGIPQDQTCGACEDCKDAPSPLHPRPNMVVHCLEGSKNHFARLLLMRAALMGDTPRRWHLHNVAVSDTARGFVHFPAEGCGELCSVDKRDQQGETSLGYDDTVVTTLDSLFLAPPPPAGDDETPAPHPRVALLKIDVEGHEPAVLRGARHSLRLGVYDIFTFEYGTVGLWAHTNLSATIVSPKSDVGAAPYACFLDAKEHVLPFSGECMDPRYDEKTWANMVCVKRSLTKLVDALMENARAFANATLGAQEDDRRVGRRQGGSRVRGGSPPLLSTLDRWT